MPRAPARCAWAMDGSPAMIEYHDREWGVPLHDDQGLFELLILEGAQAGLSWSTILNKREGYRKAFSGFDPRRIARYDTARIERLMQNPGIVRNRLKIMATIANARAFLKVQDEFGSFDAYIWRFVDGKPLRNAWSVAAEVPSRSPESDAMSRDLSRRGFKFVGTTICYAYMQATGMVNDHTTNCRRWRELNRSIV